jgi:hypothetical protein
LPENGPMDLDSPAADGPVVLASLENPSTSLATMDLVDSPAAEAAVQAGPPTLVLKPSSKAKISVFFRAAERGVTGEAAALCGDMGVTHNKPVVTHHDGARLFHVGLRTLSRETVHLCGVALVTRHEDDIAAAAAAIYLGAEDGCLRTFAPGASGLDTRHIFYLEGSAAEYVDLKNRGLCLYWLMY